MLLASGMCASIVMMLALVPAGGHIVTTTDCYRKTRMFIENFLPKMGIKVKTYAIRSYLLNSFFHVEESLFHVCNIKYILSSR